MKVGDLVRLSSVKTRRGIGYEDKIGIVIRAAINRVATVDFDGTQVHLGFEHLDIISEAVDPWWFYVLLCADGSYYAGVTTNTERRLYEHNHTKRGAKYTSSRRPVTLVYVKDCKDRMHALREEYAFKSLSRKEKLKIIQKKP